MAWCALPERQIPGTTTLQPGHNALTEQSISNKSTVAAELPSAGMAGRQVFIDPASGNVVAQPTEEQVSQAARMMNVQGNLNWSGEGLVETPVEGPAGGFKLDLKGRFLSSSTVTLNTRGQLETRCSMLAADHVHDESCQAPPDKQRETVNEPIR